MPISPDRSVVLVGLMGAGKSSIGRRLAEVLGWDFVDADAEIERASGLSVADLFARVGEPRFRDAERRTICGLIEEPKRVIATGGGAFLDDSLRSMILEKCIAVWLHAAVETLAERVGTSDDRPLLSHQDPVARLAELAAQRNPIYATAHVAVRNEAVPHEETVNQIVAALESLREPLEPRE